MQKRNLIVLPLCIGLVLILHSFYLSYPLSIDSEYDFIFNHVAPEYWVGLALTLFSSSLIAFISKRNSVRLIMCAIAMVSIYSLSYFYYMLPGSDIHLFGGLTEYHIQTGDLDPSKPYHSFFQWPLFEILGKTVVSITGMGLAQFQFLLYAILGFLYVTCLYVYASRFSRIGGYLAVVAYLMMTYMLLNYQFAPFSLAFGFILLLYMLDTRLTQNRGVVLATMVIFVIMTFAHPYAPAFFVLYELAMYILSRRKKHLNLFLFTLATYLAISIYFRPALFSYVIEEVSSLYFGAYTAIVTSTFRGRQAPTPFIANIAPIFSRTVVISTVAISLLGFLLLLKKRKLRRVDYAIFLSSAFYSAVGAVLPILGQRGLYFLFIPISLGATYFLTSKFSKYYKVLFLILIALFVFYPLNYSFYDSQIQFQTKEEYLLTNFTIDNYNWASQSSVLSHFRLMHYLQARTSSQVIFGNDIEAPNFPNDTKNYYVILYTVGLKKSFLSHNYSMTEILSSSRYNNVFDSGLSNILQKVNAK